VAPGNVASRASYLRDGRPRTIRLGRCDDAAETLSVALPQTTIPQQAAAVILTDKRYDWELDNDLYLTWKKSYDRRKLGFVVAPQGAALQQINADWRFTGADRKKKACLRVTIAESTAGESGRTCISEVVPVIGCGL